MPLSVICKNVHMSVKEQVGCNAPIFKHISSTIYNSNSMCLYHSWPCPTVIISDGPYGLDSYEGDPSSVERLPDFYEPHVKAWADHSRPSTTLWFWCSEIGWATVHPVLAKHGWRYVNCHIWDKGMAHAAGNTNTKTLRKFPIVTEVCVQYVRDHRIGTLPMKYWLRNEWRRAGLPFSQANAACHVKDAATRKYMARDHSWYFPPPKAFILLAGYANERGNVEGRPYFAKPDGTPYSEREWELMRAKFTCNVGITNVWNEPAVSGAERIKVEGSTAHPNQKPLKLIQRIIEASSDMGDHVWEPFGGTCPAAVVCARLDRICHSAETNKIFYENAIERMTTI